LKGEDKIMVVRIYALAWLLVMASAGVLLFSTPLNELTMTIFGFVVSVLAAAGIVMVLPWWVNKKYTWRYEDRALSKSTS
jgi:membrane protein YdbS with pleckstrin-like domain